MLNLKDIVVHYGGIQALKGITLEVQEGHITSLIGANGAGKSTTLRAISGLTPITSGEIWFKEQRIDGRRPEKIITLGIVHVPEGKRLFLEMSVLDNVLAGAYLRKDKDELAIDLERIYGYFPVLEKAKYRMASSLSGGEQQMLAIGRGLMAKPKLLLLDEPSLGLSPLLTKQVAGIIEKIAGDAVSILLIEQNASLAFRLSHQIYVLETGRVVLEGPPTELENNLHVKEAYLGLSQDTGASFEGVQGISPSTWSGKEAQTKIRWQDKGPQGRWQDKVCQGRWQDKADLVQQRPGNIFRETIALGQKQEAEAPARLIREPKKPDRIFEEVKAENGWYSHSGQRLRRSEDGRSSDEKLPERWMQYRQRPIENKVGDQQREFPRRRRTERISASQRRSIPWNMGETAPPRRVIKNIFVPEIRKKDT